MTENVRQFSFPEPADVNGEFNQAVAIRIFAKKEL